MCQNCAHLADLDIPPWMCEPGMKRMKKESGDKVNCQTCVLANLKLSDHVFINDIIKAHNAYRRKHSSPPLRHAADLTAHAQWWAVQLAENDNFQHSKCILKNQRIGENLAVKFTNGDTFSGKEVTDDWYSEINMHRYGRETDNSRSGHFSQVVWKESREIGVGRAKTNDGKVVVVTNYRPAGNRPGTYSTNVLPPSDTSKYEQTGKRLNMFGRSSGGESRSTKTFTETTGSGANKVTKTVVEETIIRADGSKTTNRKETITQGGSSNASTPALQSSSFPSHDDSKKKEKDKGGVLGFFGKGKDKRRGSSSTDSSPETTRKPQNLKAFIDDAVKTHNDLRKKHGVPSVKHAKDLSDYAQKWAEHMAATSSFGHSSCTLKSDRLGENIACRSGSGTVDYSGKEVTDYWYSEIKDHTFGTEPRSTGTGHFTQVVWKETKEVGFGKAKSSGGRVFVVGSYRPAGNMIGNYKDNVPPPKK